MTYEMEVVFKYCLQRYRDVVDTQTPLRNYSMIFVAEDQRDSPVGGAWSRSCQGMPLALAYGTSLYVYGVYVG